MITTKVLIERHWSSVRMKFYKNNWDNEEVPLYFQKSLNLEDHLSRGDYIRIINNLESTFPANQILISFYENLFQESSIRSICSFLDIEYLEAKMNNSIGETKVKLDLPDELRKSSRVVFEPIYDFCKKKFSDCPWTEK